VVPDCGSPSFFVSRWLPLFVSIFAFSVFDDGGAIVDGNVAGVSSSK
jgi:hypothetical protein